MNDQKGEEDDDEMIVPNIIRNESSSERPYKASLQDRDDSE